MERDANESNVRDRMRGGEVGKEADTHYDEWSDSEVGGGDIMVLSLTCVMRKDGRTTQKRRAFSPASDARRRVITGTTLDHLFSDPSRGKVSLPPEGLVERVG